MHNYFELRRIKPRLAKMRALLNENPFRGSECEGDELDTGKKVKIYVLCAYFSISVINDCVVSVSINFKYKPL